MTGTNEVSILMYHSIASGPGPLSIPPDTFRMQLDALAASGCRGVSLREYVRGLDTPRTTAEAAVVLTFDDGYRDFATVAAPELAARGWTATVFVPSRLIGGPNGWDPDGRGRRFLMDWRDTVECAGHGMEIGAHGLTHTDLTRLGEDAARREIVESKAEIEGHAGCAVTSFAAPYGRTTPALRSAIAQRYEAAVSARLAKATRRDNRYDLPRIEMWYFRDPSRWRAYLRGATGYFALRRMLRQAGAAAGYGAGPA